MVNRLVVPEVKQLPEVAELVEALKVYGVEMFPVGVPAPLVPVESVTMIEGTPAPAEDEPNEILR